VPGAVSVPIFDLSQWSEHFESLALSFFDHPPWGARYVGIRGRGPVSAVGKSLRYVIGKNPREIMYAIGEVLRMDGWISRTGRIFWCRLYCLWSRTGLDGWIQHSGSMEEGVAAGTGAWP
jgi:hypothetical protein